jgi:hypothetical protein
MYAMATSSLLRAASAIASGLVGSNVCTCLFEAMEAAIFIIAMASSASWVRGCGVDLRLTWRGGQL